jgi:hypothetical protein
MNFPNSTGEPPNTVAPRSTKPRLHLGIGEDRVDIPVELVDDLARRAFGRAADETEKWAKVVKVAGIKAE